MWVQTSSLDHVEVYQVPSAVHAARHKPKHAPARKRPGTPSNAVQLCTFAHFDQTHSRCLHQDRAVVLDQMENAQLVWLNYIGHDSLGDPDYAATFNILKRDGTGKWVVVGSGDISTQFGAVNGRVSESLGQVFRDANYGIYTDCNDTYQVQVTDLNGKVFGTVTVTLTC